MQEMQIFKYEERAVRIIVVNEVELFNIEDVAFCLGYTQNKNGKDYLRKGRIDNVLSSNDIEVIPHNGEDFITEDGLYDFILEARTDSSKQFRKWVTREVLPSIRKTGSYSMELPKTYLEALEGLVRSEKERLALEAKNKELAPKAEYFDCLVDRNLLTNFRDTAKEFHIGQKDFIDFLLSKNYIFRDKANKLKPYNHYVNCEKPLFTIKEWKSDHKSGIQTLITPYGKETFRLFINQ